MTYHNTILGALCVALAVGGCTTSDPAVLAQHDPFEPTNRAVFAFDVKLDHAVARPLAQFYRDTVPQFARQGVHNALTNLNSPVILANDVLQGEGDDAADTLGRFLINSTVGVAGLVDVARRAGIPYHDNDFGITLGKWGAQEGSYLVLPFIGPKPPRDLVGAGVDAAFDPTTYMSWNNSTLYMIVRAGMGVLDKREATLDQVEAIERSSIDFYATTRNLYRQNRRAQINGRTYLEHLPDL
jgi:phospholipid-binding lipoprotein MlaA